MLGPQVSRYTPDYAVLEHKRFAFSTPLFEFIREDYHSHTAANIEGAR